MEGAFFEFLSFSHAHESACRLPGEFLNVPGDVWVLRHCNCHIVPCATLKKLRRSKNHQSGNCRSISNQQSKISISPVHAGLHWEVLHLMLAKALAPHISGRTRVKGSDYFRAGGVIEMSGGPWTAHAIVRGTRDYRVELMRESASDRFTASCECPFYSDRGEICKHIWASVLEAERRGLLTGDGEPLPTATIEPEYRPTVDAPRVGTILTAGKAAAKPPAWERFLHDIRQDLVADERFVPVPRFSNGQIVYAIDVRETLVERGTVVNVLFRQRRKNGTWTKPKSITVTPLEAEHLSDPADREICSLLMGAGNLWLYGNTYESGFSRSRYVLNGPLEDRLLPLIAKSGRGHLTRVGDEEGLFPLEWDDGPPWRFDLRITNDERSDEMRVEGAFVRNGERLALSEPVLLLARGFLFTRTTMARLDVEGGFAWIARLRSFGPVSMPREHAGALMETVARSGLDPRALPPDLRYEVVDGTPRPRVRVARPERQNPYALRQDLRATVHFEYGGVLVEGTPGQTAYDSANRRLVRRNRAAEQAAIDRLHELGFRYTWSHFESRQLLGISPDQFPRVVHTLVSEGWRVEAEGRPFRPAVGMRLEVSSGIDWFDLHGYVDFGDGRSAPFPQLLAAVARGEDVVVLDDGSVGLLPEEWLRRYAAVAGFGSAEGDSIRFGRSQAALLDALLAAQPAITYDESFARIRDELHTFSGVVPLDPPASFQGTLREYQREALGWFEFLRKFGFGGCLADDMGLGKTVMVLALLDARRHTLAKSERLPSLVVVPRSLVFNWIEESRRFAPKLKIVDYTGALRDASTIAGSDLVLTTYGTLRRDAGVLNGIEFDYAILDEAQAIKNAATASAKAARLLRSRYRLALSGTPIENHLGELWSVFEFLNPGLLGSAKAFQRASSARTRDDLNLEWLARALRPFILRRTKEQVAPELPRRTEQTLVCELEGVQRKHYDELRAHYRQTLLAKVARDGLNKSKMQILEALLRLRQAACHSGLIDPGRADEPSAKFDVLIPRLVEVIEEGHKALVFSQFTSLLALLRPRLESIGLVYEYLDGRTRDRAARVERFQTDPACPLFLISLKAGGLGLNLTAAEYVFLLDPWWNPAVEAQAIDRAHRIGQSRHVFAYRLLAHDTVEEKVAELQNSKRELAEAILNADSALIRTLRAEDLELLLS
jgi:superfamily II DNA or RNA helicase